MKIAATARGRWSWFDQFINRPGFLALKKIDRQIPQILVFPVNSIVGIGIGNGHIVHGEPGKREKTHHVLLLFKVDPGKPDVIVGLGKGNGIHRKPHAQKNVLPGEEAVLQRNRAIQVNQVVVAFDKPWQIKGFGEDKLCLPVFKYDFFRNLQIMGLGNQ